MFILTYIQFILFIQKELINRIVQLEAHNQQLKNMLRKDGTYVDKEAKIAKQKKFNFSKYVDKFY